MKKALKLLSAILCLAMVFSMFAALPTSAAVSAQNLIQYPDFTLKDDGKISGWNFDSNYDQDSYAVETDEDGSSVLVIDKLSQDHNFNLGTTGVTNLSVDKFYKLSVWIKMDENSLGKYTYASWATASILLKEKSSNRYNISDIFPTADKNGVWKEYSIIISGENFYTEENSYTELSFYTAGTACKYYFKNPSITEYDPDVIDEVAKIETSNLISNSDFSQYDGTADATTTNRFTGFTISSKGTLAANHEQATVTLNGRETTAAKITSADPNNNGFQAFFNPKIDKTKDYRLSMWVMLTPADVKDETTGTWVSGTGWDVDGSISLMAGKQNGNIKKTVAIAETKNVWQYVELLVDSEWHSANVWTDGIRFGITTWGCDFNIYMTDVRVEEFIGDVVCSAPENILDNGDFEIYDETTNKFSGWNVTLWQTGTITTACADGISGNALKYIATNIAHTGEVKRSITIDPAFDYKVVVHVKTENSEDVIFSNPDTTWNLLYFQATAGTVTAKSDEIKYADDWQKIELTVTDIPEGTTTMQLRMFAGQVRGTVLLDDISVTPILGGRITANRANAKSGDTVIVTVNPDWGKKLAENGLTYLASGATECVAITDNKSDAYTTQVGDDEVERKVYTSVASDNPNIYQFAMPQNADVVISAVFEDIALVAGDIDWDGAVNVLDIVRLKKYIGGIEVQINTDNATLESETAEIDGLDLTILRQILLGIN